jgi:chromosome segregation ATPase
MSREPENLVLRTLRDIRADAAEIKAELRSLAAAVASDFLTVNAKIDATRKELSDQIVGLRRAVVEYHSVVIGHGVLISELEARLRRVEQHLNLAAGDAQ